MITLICKTCGKEFKVFPHRKNAKFCSPKCVGKYRNKRIFKKCLICGKNFEIKYYRTQQGACLFCSQKCFGEYIKKTKLKLGENHWNWKGGHYQKKDNRWYIWINPIRMKQSKWIAESCLERPLTKTEVVHHINKDKSDDRPENLYVFPTQTEHAQFHQLKFKPILISNLI